MQLNTSVSPVRRHQDAPGLAGDHGIDRRLNEIQNDGLPTVANGPFAPGTIGYLEDPGFPKYDLDKAKKLVKEYRRSRQGPSSRCSRPRPTPTPCARPSSSSSGPRRSASRSRSVQATRPQLIDDAIGRQVPGDAVPQLPRWRPRHQLRVVVRNGQPGELRSAHDDTRSTSSSTRAAASPTRPSASRSTRTSTSGSPSRCCSMWSGGPRGPSAWTTTSTASSGPICPTAPASRPPASRPVTRSRASGSSSRPRSARTGVGAAAARFRPPSLFTL